MKLAISILFLIFSKTIVAQKNFVRIEKVSKGKDFNFPIISLSNKLVQEKINTYLQLAELDLLKGKQKKNIFEKVSVDPGTIYGGKVAIDYEVLSNSNKNLAIKFTEASCGATCTYWVRYYNFNPKNGDKYSLLDLFNPKEYKIFSKRVTSLRKENIKQQIKKLKKEAQPELILEYLFSSIENDDLEDFYFTDDHIYFDVENRLHKNDKFWDIYTKSSVAIKEIKHLLNKKGKAVLVTGANLKSIRSTIEPQLYTGVINKNLEFFLIFKNDYRDNFRGTYTYKKYGKGIYIEGKATANSFVFKEKDDNFKETASLSFTKTGENLNGFWEDKKGNKFTFEAKRQ